MYNINRFLLFLKDDSGYRNDRQFATSAEGGDTILVMLQGNMRIDKQGCGSRGTETLANDGS